MDIKSLIAALKRQDFGPGDSQIASALMHPVEAINRGGEWFRHNASVAGGGDPYDNPNPLIGPGREEQAEASMNIAGLAELGSFPLAPRSAGGTLGTFIGPKAKTWDAKRAALAEKLLDEGVDPEQVWKEHLIGRLPGKQLFSEIPDHIASITPNKGVIERGSEVYRGNLPDLLHHKPLYDNYDLSNIRTTLRTNNPESGSFDPGGDEVGLFSRPWVQAEAPTVEQLKPSVLHEVQHAIQTQEGWPLGGSPKDNSPEAVEVYNRLTGEALSRSAAKRADMSMLERRASYPLANDMLDDVPLKGPKGLIDYYGPGTQKSTPELPETEYSLAHKIAQEHAALPVEQGGLGLPPNNTAMDRAKALGFDTDAYHGTKPRSHIGVKETPDILEAELTPGMFDIPEAFYSTKDPIYSNAYAREGTTGKGAVYPLSVNSKLSQVDDRQNEIRTLSNNGIRSRFAAFDPFKKDSANILASILAGTTLASQMDKNNGNK